MASEQPWQPQGYQALADLQAAYPDSAIYRRFSSLNAFVLLSLQARLVNLQFELEKLCCSDDYSSIGDEKSYSTNFNALFASRVSQAGSRDGQLAKLQEVQGVMAQYYDLLDKTARVGRLPRPENHQVRFLNEWLWTQNDKKGNEKGFLVFEERLTLGDRYKDDFVSLGPTDAWLNPWIIDLFHWLRHVPSDKETTAKVIDFFHWLRHGSSDTKTTAKADLERGVIQDVEKSFIMRTSRLIWQLFITLFAAMLPVLAILVLYFVKDSLHRINIAIGMTAGAGVFLKIFTAADTKEIFGATAA